MQGHAYSAYYVTLSADLGWQNTQQHTEKWPCMQGPGTLEDDVVALPGTAPNWPQQAREACGRLNALIPCMP